MPEVWRECCQACRQFCGEGSSGESSWHRVSQLLARGYRGAAGPHGEAFHRVDLVFHCEYRSDLPDAVLSGDTNQIGYDWLEIATLNRTPLYPSRLRRQIMNYYEGKPYLVYLGKEEIGDPECLE